MENCLRHTEKTQALKIEKDTVTFSSGRIRSANCGIIGLGPDLHVSQGFDGGFWLGYEATWTPKKDRLTKEDLAELADFMIEAWQRFKANHGT